MQLEDYFEFLSPTAIRIKGTRVGIETVVIEYRNNRRTPEEILAEYPTLSREQIDASLAYYHLNREQIDEYLRQRDAEYWRLYEEFWRNPPPGMARLRALKTELSRQAAEAAGCDSGPLYDEQFRIALAEYKQRATS